MTGSIGSAGYFQKNLNYPRVGAAQRDSAEIQEIQNQISIYNQNVTETQEQKSGAENEKTQIDAETEASMQAIQSSVSQTTAELASATSTLASAVSNLSSANSNAQSAASALASTPPTITETTKGEDGKEKPTEKENPAYVEAMNAYNEALQAVAEAQAQMETAQNQVDAIQTQAQEFQNALQEMATQSEQEESQADEQIEAFESQIEQYDSAITALETQLQQLQAQQAAEQQNAQNNFENAKANNSDFLIDNKGNYSYSISDKTGFLTGQKQGKAQVAATKITYNDDGSVTKSNPDGTSTKTKIDFKDGKVVVTETKIDKNGIETPLANKPPLTLEKDENGNPVFVSADDIIKNLAKDAVNGVGAYEENLKNTIGDNEPADSTKETEGTDNASDTPAVPESEDDKEDKTTDSATGTDDSKNDDEKEIDPKDIENNISNNSKTPLIYDDSSKKLTIGDKEIEINEDGLTNDDIFNLKEDTSNGEKLYGETKDGRAVAISIDDNGDYKVEISTEDKKDTAEKYTVGKNGATTIQTAVLDDDGNIKTDDSGNKMYEYQGFSAAQMQYAQEHKGEEDKNFKDGQVNIDNPSFPLKTTTNDDGDNVIEYAGGKQVVLDGELKEGYSNSNDVCMPMSPTIKTYSGKDKDGNDIVINMTADNEYYVRTINPDTAATVKSDGVTTDGTLYSRTFKLDEDGKNVKYQDSDDWIDTYTQLSKEEIEDGKTEEDAFVRHTLQGGENYDRAYTERDAIRNHEELKTIENGLDNEDDFQGTLIDTDKYFDKFHNDYDKNDAASFAEYLDKVSEDITNDIVQHFEDYCLEENTVNTDKLTDIYKQIAIDNNIDTSALDSSDNDAFIDGINEIMAKTSWDGKLGNDYFDLSKIDEKIEDGTVGQEEKSEFALDINDDFTEINFGGNTIKLTDEGLKQTSTVGDKTNYSGTDEDGNEIMVSVDENGSYTIYKFDGDDKTKRNESYYLTSKGEFNETKYEYDKDGKKTSETSTTTTKAGDITQTKTQFLTNGTKVSMHTKEENGETVYEVQGEAYKTQEEAEKALKEIVKKDKEEAQKAKEED